AGNMAQTPSRLMTRKAPMTIRLGHAADQTVSKPPASCASATRRRNAQLRRGSALLVMTGPLSARGFPLHRRAAQPGRDGLVGEALGRLDARLDHGRARAFDHDFGGARSRIVVRSHDRAVSA